MLAPLQRRQPSVGRIIATLLLILLGVGLVAMGIFVYVIAIGAAINAGMEARPTVGSISTAIAIASGLVVVVGVCLIVGAFLLLRKKN